MYNSIIGTLGNILWKYVPHVVLLFSRPSLCYQG